MDILVGILTIIVLVLALFIISALKVAKEEPIEEKPQKIELTEEEKQKQEELRKNFQNLMDYDYEVALKRK